MTKSPGEDEDQDEDGEEEEDEEDERTLRVAAAGRCSLLDVSTSICGSRWPRTGLLSPVSPNQKTGSVPPADWSSTATVKTAIGQSARVTHGYHLHQQHLTVDSRGFATWSRVLLHVLGVSRAHMPRLTPT